MANKKGPISLTEEQRQVVAENSDRFLVQASAGSGKTSALVERYLAEIQSGLRPHQILTITFTRRAAAEMKERIGKRLLEMGLLKEAQEAETGPIQTIHSFCDRLLRENALSAGLDTGFEIGEDIAALQAAATESVLSEADPRDPWLSHLMVQDSNNVSNDPFRSIGARVTELVDDLRSNGLVFEELEANYASAESTLRFWRESLLEYLLSRLEGPTDVEIPNVDDPAFERFRSVFNKLGAKWYPSLNKDKLEVLDAAMTTASMVQLALRSWIKVEQAMMQKQQFDFTAIERLAVNLLTHNPATRNRLQRQYEIVIVDEAQDLNPTQHQLLDAMNPRRLMLVGDIKQSIFGWRQAEPGLYLSRAKEMQARQLSQNHRSTVGIQSFVDHVFLGLIPDYVPMQPRPIDDTAPAPNWDEIEVWKAAKESEHRQIAAQIKVRIEEQGLKASDVCILVNRNSVASKLKSSLADMEIQSKVDGAYTSLYTRMEIRDMANILSAISDPRDEHALVCSLRSPYVDLSLDAIAELSLNPPIRINFATTPLSSPTDDAKRKAFVTWLAEMRKVADRLPAWEALSLLMQRLKVAETLLSRPDGEQRLANVRKLLRIAARRPEQGPREFAKWAKDLAAIKHREADAPDGEQGDRVLISTIHRAKGLEWPVVIVCDTAFSRPNEGASYVNPKLGMVVADKDIRNPYYIWLKELEAERSRSENNRLLYVALTRAEKQLWIVTTEGAKRDSHGMILAKALNSKTAENRGIKTVEL